MRALRFPFWMGGAAAAVFLLTLLPGPASATPSNRAAFLYTSAVGSRLDDLPSISGHCGVCHYAFTGGGPRNWYGQALEAELPLHPGNPTGKQAAVRAIEDLDSDFDGYTNVTEITDLIDYANTPTFPGLTSGDISSVSNVDINDILAYLTPTTSVDNTPPTVTVLGPDGGESWIGGQPNPIEWMATDDVGVANVDLYYRDGEAEPWTLLAKSYPNLGSFNWFVLNTPTTSARVRVVARDAAGNTGEDMSNATFTILAQPGLIAPTTLRDFKQPGTQPAEAGPHDTSGVCLTCHGGYNSAVEPGHNFQGSLMAQAARDPLFYACVAVAEQDAPSAGDMCIRCHSPFGWTGGRSTPTNGSQLNSADRDGVACDFCHRLVDPIYKAGVSPPEDETLLSGMVPSHVPTSYSNGQYVLDPNPRKRGPFLDAVALHPILPSAFHRTADLCGTCHDVSNPVFEHVAGADYAPGPLDQEAATIASDLLMPLERTYSEWKNSSYALSPGVYAPDFAGNKADGYVSICQDCHMKDVSGKGCVDPTVPTRPDLPLHDLTGGNTWMGGVIASLYPTETDAAALADGAARATSMLQKAATLGLDLEAVADSYDVHVTVTNRTGHKLPTGYPEGRRIWLHVLARDIGGNVVYESGAYNYATGILSMTPLPVVYEAEMGISPALAAALDPGGTKGLTPGPTFHFALNDSVYKDNRIPPLGFTNAAFAAFGGTPVDPEHPGQRYADGQNWDTSTFTMPRSAVRVWVELLYQTTSREYITFLRDQNVTTTAGDNLYDAWVLNGRAAPVVMESDSLVLNPTAVAAEEDLGPTVRRVAVLSNPFDRALPIALELSRPAPVVMDVFDVRGRRVSYKNLGTMGGGPHQVVWQGRDDTGRSAGAGIYWVSLQVGERRIVRQVVRIK
jgi:hypothetical protein